MCHVPIKDYYGPTFWILEFELFNNFMYTKSSEKIADSCQDHFILSFISAQELDCFDNSGLKVFTFWRIAGHMLHVLATPFLCNLCCSAL